MVSLLSNSFFFIDASSLLQALAGDLSLRHDTERFTGDAVTIRQTGVASESLTTAGELTGRTGGGGGAGDISHFVSSQVPNGFSVE
jgi:hypothetical protein